VYSGEIEALLDKPAVAPDFFNRQFGVPVDASVVSKDLNTMQRALP